MATAMNLAARLDPLDVALLEALQQNARTPLSEIGRRIGLSQPATSERVRRLEDIGIIQGYGVRLDPAAMGLGVRVAMRLRINFDRYRPCLEHLRGLPEVIEVRRLTGDDCLDLSILLAEAADIEPIIDDLGRFGDVRTAIVLHAEPPKPIGRALLRKRGR